MTSAMLAAERQVIRITGADRVRFLQDLVTNDVSRLAAGPVYAALLTPQGKYLADFFLEARGEAVLMDAHTAQAGDLIRRLSMYKLRADVALEPVGLSVVQGTGAAPGGAWPDPRDPALGWRLITDSPGPVLAAADPMSAADWAALRVAAGVPEAGVELLPGESFVLEMGFDRLHGVDFRKGCYVGQEVTARMRHKTELRKGLVRVRLEGAAPPPGTPVERDGKTVGTLHSAAGDAALAYLRYDRAGPGMTAGGASVTWEGGGAEPG